MRSSEPVRALGFLVALAAFTVPALAAPPTFDLGQVLFVYDHPERDRDEDGLKDDLEFKLADAFRPLYVFDEEESARRGVEPVTLFQVRPTGGIGAGSPTPWRVWISYLYLFQRDGGWPTCPGGSHNGDNGSVRIRLLSTDGRRWQADQTQQGYKEEFDLDPGYAEWHRDRHLVVYFSRDKHHPHASMVGDEEDSPASCCGCNEYLDGGPRILAHVGTAASPHNAGEPEQHPAKGGGEEESDRCDFPVDAVVSHVHHPRFACHLDAFGFPGEKAWDVKPFTGGLEDEGGTGCNYHNWIFDAFHFSEEEFAEQYRALALLRGKVVDHATKQAIPGAKLYYRAFDPLAFAFGGLRGPWWEVWLDAEGKYEVAVPVAGGKTSYLLRPAASDYDFDRVPDVVLAEKGKERLSAFYGVRRGLTKLAEESGVQIAAPESREGSAGTSKLAAQSGAEEGAKVVGSLALQKERRLERDILRFSVPKRLVAADPKPIGKVVNDVDPVVRLPFKAVIGVNVRSVLDADGKPAATRSAVAYHPPKKYHDHRGRPLEKPGGPVMGGPVEGAKIRARVKSGAALVGRDLDPAELKTNADGNAFLLLSSGAHPGWTQLEIEIVENPANPWAVFEVASERIEIQPAIHGDDKQTKAAVKVEPAPPELAIKVLDPRFKPPAKIQPRPAKD